MRISALLCISVLVLTGGVVGGEPAGAGRVVAEGDAEAGADLEAYLRRLESLGFAGSVVIARNASPILAAGYGLADRERGRRWGPSTVSTVGSITKQFTGAAILALVEAGLLSVDDRISRYFDPVPEDKRDITLYHLLTHSSGIVDLDGLGDWDPVGREEFIHLAMEQELAFAPGTRYRYSNAGFSLLGAVIEQLTGSSWESYVRERLLLPVGMFETGYILPQWGEGQMAQGYRDGERWGTVLGRPLADDGPYWVLRANGGVHSTVLDMLRWGQALLDGRPLSAESMEILWSPHFDEGGGDSFYGYGWVVTEMGGRRVITHNGGNGILFADMAIVPEENLVMVIQTNVVANFPLAEGLLEVFGARLLAGTPLPSVPDRAETMPGDIARFTGRYAIEGGGALQVSLAAEELTVEPLDRRAFTSLLSTRPGDAARAQRMSGRIDEVVAAYLAGDWAPLWEAYDREMSLEALETRAGGRIAAMVESNGPVSGHAVLGTAFRDGRDVTLVRIDFERGEVYRAYVWDPDEEASLLGVSGRGLDHVLHVLPENGGTFASWDIRTGESRPVRFSESGGGGIRLVIGDRIALEAVRRGRDRP